MFCINCKKEFKPKGFLFFKKKYCCESCEIAHTIKKNIKIKANGLDFDKQHERAMI